MTIKPECTTDSTQTGRFSKNHPQLTIQVIPGTQKLPPDFWVRLLEVYAIIDAVELSERADADADAGNGRAA